MKLQFKLAAIGVLVAGAAFLSQPAPAQAADPGDCQASLCASHTDCTNPAKLQDECDAYPFCEYGIAACDEGQGGCPFGEQPVDCYSIQKT